ncbi:MAG: hypothetical protein R3D85_15825 [Paracoccaceae bacterium]
MTGDLALEGCTWCGRRRPALAFDIMAERVAVNVALLSLLGDPVIETAEVVGVRGYLAPPARDKDRQARPKKEKRPFTVGDIHIEDVALDVRPEGRAAWAFEVSEARVAPFGSRSALFDLLFRSNLRASLAGQALAVETREITQYGRETHWRFEDVDSAKLQLLLPRAPLTWIERGRMSAVVDDRWSLSEDWIEMDWSLSFEDVSVAVPDGAGLREKALASGFGKLVAAKGGDATFRYRLVLDREQIAVARSGDLAGFWAVVAEGLIGGAGTAESKAATVAADGTVRRALEKAKGLLKPDD